MVVIIVVMNVILAKKEKGVPSFRCFFLVIYKELRFYVKESYYSTILR